MSYSSFVFTDFLEWITACTPGLSPFLPISCCPNLYPIHAHFLRSGSKCRRWHTICRRPYSVRASDGHVEENIKRLVKRRRGLPALSHVKPTGPWHSHLRYCDTCYNRSKTEYYVSTKIVYTCGTLQHGWQYGVEYFLDIGFPRRSVLNLWPRCISPPSLPISFISISPGEKCPPS